jgi:hypothetical protein
MCFSAPVSFAAGGVMAAVGGVTLSKVRHKTEVPFAVIPLIFALHQFIEGGVWLSFGVPFFNQILTYAYLMISHVLWPVWVPFAIMALEKDIVRRKILVFLFAIGLVVGMSQFYYIVSEPVYSQIVNNSILYVVPQSFGIEMMLMYLMATCLSCAVSSHPYVKIFGLLSFVSFIVAYYFFTVTCLSTWCFFAAILSAIVFLHFAVRPPSISSLKPIRLPKLKLLNNK